MSTKRTLQCLDNSHLQEVFFSKLTQFSQGNNSLDPPDSYTDGFYLVKHVFLQFS
jgi:hypothetical protein